MNCIREIVVRRRTKRRNDRAGRYEEAPIGRKERLALQLALFNRCWQNTRQNVAFYRRLVDDGKAPEQFDDWDQFLACTPVVNRSFAQRNLDDLTDTSRSPEFYRITGGSTAEPIQLPAWKSEILENSANTWLGRSWYNINPEDPLFMIWGHSHLLGSGIRGWLNGHIRELKDRILGYTRFSAYDLSHDRLKEAGNVLRKSQPAYVYGYSAALDRFARANEGTDLSTSKLKAVIATAECFPAEDSADLLAQLFDAAVAMEYGSEETGVLAYTRPEGGYGVFWLSYFLEAIDEGPCGGRVVRVTSLYPRCFPLLRYELGDEVGLSSPGFGIDSFVSVKGRSNDFILLEGGKRIHPLAVKHCLQGCASISSFQMAQIGDDLVLRVVARGELTVKDITEVKRKLSKISRDLIGTQVTRVDKLAQTRAGKTPMIIRS